MRVSELLEIREQLQKYDELKSALDAFKSVQSLPEDDPWRELWRYFLWEVCTPEVIDTIVDALSDKIEALDK